MWLEITWLESISELSQHEDENSQTEQLISANLISRQKILLVKYQPETAKQSAEKHIKIET